MSDFDGLTRLVEERKVAMQALQRVEAQILAVIKPHVMRAPTEVHTVPQEYKKDVVARMLKENPGLQTGEIASTIYGRATRVYKNRVRAIVWNLRKTGELSRTTGNS